MTRKSDPLFPPSNVVKETYFATFGVEDVNVCRGMRARTPRVATGMAMAYASALTRLTGRVWEFKRLDISFPESQVVDEEAVIVTDRFGRKFRPHGIR